MVKRTSLKDRKGVDILFDSTDDLETKAQKSSDSLQSSKEDSRDYNVSKDPNLVKITVFIRNDQMADIEQIQVDERRRTGIKPDKYKLAQEAYDLLIQKYKNT
ncbi:MAG: hypothetical protein WAQ98_18550 [Blastocatellia bacterium]